MIFHSRLLVYQMVFWLLVFGTHGFVWNLTKSHSKTDGFCEHPCKAAGSNMNFNHLN